MDRSRVAGAAVVLALIIAVLLLLGIGRRARRDAYGDSTVTDPGQPPEGVAGPVNIPGMWVHRHYPPRLVDTPWSALNFGASCA